VQASPTQVNEGQNATFNFMASPANHLQVTVYYSMSGKATLGTDYTLSGTPGRIIIPAGQGSATITLHSLEDNVRRERNEVATMTVQKGTGYRLSNRRASVAIVDQ
jgi:hypothetical protein